MQREITEVLVGGSPTFMLVGDVFFKDRVAVGILTVNVLKTNENVTIKYFTEGELVYHFDQRLPINQPLYVNLYTGKLDYLKYGPQIGKTGSCSDEEGYVKIMVNF